MIDEAKLSSLYRVQKMQDRDADEILALCRGNRLYYELCGEETSKEQILRDLHAAPPGVASSDKYYLGFYDEKELLAVIDLIDGYPKPEYAFIGFFMMNIKYQGAGTGTKIISEIGESLKSLGKQRIRLAIAEGNPQATHFWEKNGFQVIRRIPEDGWTVLVAEKAL